MGVSKTVRKQPREQLPAGLRFDVIARDDFTCQACGDRPGSRLLHVDHIYPWSMGGSHDPLNLLTLCRSCNLAKHARVFVPRKLLLDDYRQDGWATWKRFGVWAVQVCDRGIVLECVEGAGRAYWIDINRVWEGYGGMHSWEAHIERKGWVTGEVYVDLVQGLEFLRAIYRQPG
jgi:hypothetical protein